MCLNLRHFRALISKSLVLAPYIIVNFMLKYMMSIVVCRQETEQKRIRVKVESGDEIISADMWRNVVLVAVHNNPYDLVNSAITCAASISGTAKPVNEKVVPKSIDVFGWCSWDAFYSSVSTEGIYSAVLSLQRGNTPPGFVIIDDGWQDTDLEEAYDAKQFPRKHLLPHKYHSENMIESESKVLASMMNDMSDGSSVGATLQSLKAAKDHEISQIDYHSLAIEHTKGKHDLEIERIPGFKEKSNSQPAYLKCFERVKGVAVGLIQAVIFLIYEQFVDQAHHESWYVRYFCLPFKFKKVETILTVFCRTVKCFSYLASSVLKVHLLNFFADQTTFTRRLWSVKANKKFEGGFEGKRKQDFADAISQLKNNLRVQYVFCWHGISAYWSGVSVNSPETVKYSPHVAYAQPSKSIVEVEPSMKWNPSVLVGMGAIYDPEALFRDMHRYLSEAGVSGVKVDCQAGTGLLGSISGGGPLVAARYHDALESSVASSFPGNHVINCMCHMTDNIYNWRETAVARASDDFYPSDQASHSPHIVACVYNGLFLSPLVVPDFDMFQSNHKSSKAHAIARAISGGPIYISDKPGDHNFDLLEKLVLPDSSILRPNTSCMPMHDCLFTDVCSDGRTLLKVWNKNSITGVIGVFNVQGSSWSRERRKFWIHDSSPSTLSGEIYRQHFQGYFQDESLNFVVYYMDEDRETVMFLNNMDPIRVDLAPGDAISITVAPVLLRAMDFAPLGLLRMINGGGAIEKLKYWREGIKVEATTSIEFEGIEGVSILVKGWGLFGSYCTRTPTTCTIDRELAEFAWSPDDCLLKLDIPFDSNLHKIVDIFF